VSTDQTLPGKIADDLDFVSVHLYPKAGRVNDAVGTLAGFSVGKPVCSSP
jgi:hypothetical protein